MDYCTPLKSIVKGVGNCGVIMVVMTYFASSIVLRLFFIFDFFVGPRDTDVFLVFHYLWLGGLVVSSCGRTSAHASPVFVTNGGYEHFCIIIIIIITI